MATVKARVDAAMKRRLQELMAERGESEAVILRMIVKEYFDTRKKT